MAPPPHTMPDLDEETKALLRLVPPESPTRARSDAFYRELAQYLARRATIDFSRSRGAGVQDGAAAVASYVQHQERQGRLAAREISVGGQGFHVQADVHQCPFQLTCQSNLGALGEIPQCIRAVTLIEAMSAQIPDRPPMTYDLDPGLVDGSSDACHIQLRPAGVPTASK